MPKYTIDVDNQSYEIETENELTQPEYDSLVSDIRNQTKAQQNLQKIKDLPKTAYNTLRKFGHGALYGQGSHVAGIGEGVGEMLYDVVQPVRKSIDNLSQLKNPFKPLKEVKQSFGNDYTKGYTEEREKFKQEMKQFEEEHPELALASEIAGAIATGGGVSGVTKGVAKKLLPETTGKVASKIASFVKNPVVQSGVEGATYGGLYGLSNTEGEGADLKNAGIGAGLGALLGSTASAGGKGLKRGFDVVKNEILPTYSKAMKEFAPMKLLEEALMTNKTSKIATKGEQLADEKVSLESYKIVDKLKQQVENGDKEAEKLLNKMKDKGLQSSSETHKGNLNENLKSIPKTIDDIGDELFTPFNDATINLNNLNTIKNIENMIEKSNVDKIVKDNATKVINKIKDKIKNGNIKYKDLRKEMKNLYDLETEITYLDGDRIHVDSRLGGQEGIDFYKAIRGELSNARNQNEGIKQASKVWNEILNAHSKTIEQLGKNYSQGKAINRFLAELRDRNIPIVSETFEKIEQDLNKTISNMLANPTTNPKYVDALKKYLKVIKDINDNSKLLKVSYDVKPDTAKTVVGKKLSTGKAIGKIYNEATSPQTKLQNFIENGKTGQLNEQSKLARFNLFRNPIERFFNRRSIINKNFKVPSLYNQAEKQQIKRNIADFYNRRIKNLIDLANRGGLVPKSSIRALMQQYYDNKEQR